MTDSPSLPVLPPNFDELTKHLSKQARDAEFRQRRTAFNSACSRLEKWIRQDRRPQMTATAKLIAAFLVNSVNFETGRCNPSHETIADHVGISVRHVRRLIPQIAKAGWITYRRAAHNRPTFYTLHAPQDIVAGIEERAELLREERFRRRSNRTSMSAQQHASDRTSTASSNRTSMSSELKNRTEDNYKTSIESQPIKVELELRRAGSVNDGGSSVPDPSASPSNIIPFRSLTRGAA